MPATLAAALRARHNDHTRHRRAFETRTGLGWHETGPPTLGAGGTLSVVVPAHENAYSLPAVLDALHKQDTAAAVEVIVVDDASTDATTRIVREHPAVTSAVRLPERVGAGAARNCGTLLAEGDTVVYLDADMVLPPHVLADLAARAAEDLVLIGFRHNVPHGDLLPPGEPDLDADHRVRWSPPAGVPMFYSGQLYDTPFTTRPLDDTGDLVELGFGRAHHDWDLPRMVVTALMAAPRAALLDVGGFHPAFGPDGWGTEDTHLGAALIAAGLLVVPVRQARGHHLDPPDAAAAWRAKLAGAAPRIARHRALLDRPPPSGLRGGLIRRAATLLAGAETLR